MSTRRSSTFETLKSKQRGLLNFYLHQVEGNREINLCRSFLILKFLIFTVPDNTQQHCGCLGSDVWLKKSSFLMIFSSLIFQAVENVFLSIPCWYTPYKAWKLFETFRKITNNGAPHTRGGGGTLGISGWGCAAGTLEPLTYTRASSAEFCYPILE